MNMLKRLARKHPEEFELLDRNGTYTLWLKGAAYYFADWYEGYENSVYVNLFDYDDAKLNEERKLKLRHTGSYKTVEDFGELEKIAMEYVEKCRAITKRLMKERRIKMIEGL